MLCTDVPFGILVVFYLIYAAGTDSCRQLYIWFVVSSSCVWTRKLLCLEEQILRSFFLKQQEGIAPLLIINILNKRKRVVHQKS